MSDGDLSANVTERQRKWMESVRASLERDTGKTLAQWAAIARACPESGHRARLKWLKDEHGLLQNRAAHVLSEAFGSRHGWDDPATLAAGLWADPAAARVRDAIDACAMALGEVIRTQRKGYTAWSHRVQFAAARPLRAGAALVGLAVPADADPRLEPRGRQSWSERLTARLRLAAPEAVDDRFARLLRRAWEGA